jgi:hypothetical protein
MRTLILKVCVIVAAGLSSCALAAGPLYTNKEYCFSALQPADMSISTVRQGAQFNFGKRCGIVGESGCNSILVYAMHFFAGIDLLADATDMYPSDKGWVVKPDDDLGPAKGWSQQTLVRGSGDQGREAHIYSCCRLLSQASFCASSFSSGGSGASAQKDSGKFQAFTYGKGSESVPTQPARFPRAEVAQVVVLAKPEDTAVGSRATISRRRYETAIVVGKVNAMVPLESLHVRLR